MMSLRSLPLLAALSSPTRAANGYVVLGCADEDSAYLSKRMPRVGTSDDARVSTVVNITGREIRPFSPGRHTLDGPVLPACP
jgi:hypothetical protein